LNSTAPPEMVNRKEKLLRPC